MPPAMASSQLEMTISVFSPRLTNTSSSHNIVIGAGTGWSVGAWNVNLQRIGQDGYLLSMGITWDRPEKQNFIKFRSINVISRAGIIAVKVEDLDWWDGNNQHMERASFPEESVLIGDKYDFDVVFSTEPDFLRTIPTPAPAPVIKQKSVPQSTPASKEKSLISLLLKDPSSVDVCFTFTNNKACSNIGLWAHRFLLSQHDSFAKAIQDALTVQSLGDMVLADTKAAEDVDSDAESTSNLSVDTAITATGAARGISVGAASKELFIKIDTISLATFCVMLYYIYTGEIDRTVDATRFVLSDTNKVSLVWQDSAGKVEESVDWRPLDEDSPWRLKDVTWEELKDAAIDFGLKDLQAVAERNLYSSPTAASATASTAVPTTTFMATEEYIKGVSRTIEETEASMAERTTSFRARAEPRKTFKATEASMAEPTTTFRATAASTSTMSNHRCSNTHRDTNRKMCSLT
ncbi:hypothetical protein K457DRAFT_900466 [Linnemannia elongata AG-77]|uniref:BTB domain-containing protein n=1 Tax=Linnemannia elongata AG-77 TaxID=1314771 RepID=A0A197JMZ1_9FUNG|nr:hypothetical protein K457DRAFT_900466 [Linnemannia elongata AG-77]